MQKLFETACLIQPHTGVPFPITPQELQSRGPPVATKAPASFEKGRVMELNYSALFERKKDSHVWVVKFDSPNHDYFQALNQTFIDIAANYENVSNIHFGEVSCTKDFETCQLGPVKRIPILKLYTPSATFTLSSSLDYAGITSWIKSKLESQGFWNETEAKLIRPRSHINPLSLITVLDNKNMDILNNGSLWFVKFYAQWCGHCVTFAPVYLDLAITLRNVPGLRFAEIDCGQFDKECLQYHVMSYPSTILISNGIKDIYNGKRNVEKISTYIMNYISKHPDEKSPEKEVDI
ncbi:putative Thioredoxin [Blattamonas nauphoetae]|uniref:Thioredoxin n=1 Tax=Blattamonas nauphoetae TaxID=2049346 RepID=A0ABQ9Y473_9EUKA|nr:putative Thioredoxin [Blattamonas nauphoetae]